VRQGGLITPSLTLRAAARNLASLISDATFLIGYLMAAFTPRKRALHDMIAGCLVVKNDA
jgi:uncharacterized RDD family membrane protein YckC